MGLRLKSYILLRNLNYNANLGTLFHSRPFKTWFSLPKYNGGYFSKAAAVIGIFGVGGGLYGYLAAPDRSNRAISYPLSELMEPLLEENIPYVRRPSREVTGPAIDVDLDLTLFQYQNCPFCCKVRAFLDYRGISYKVIEVNPVKRQQIKFSKYKKVPILLAKEKVSDKLHQLNDSSVIISALDTYLLNNNNGLENILQYYIPVAYKNDEGKVVEEVMNKYFLMYGESLPKNQDGTILKEREWRQWADDVLVHILSPNIYRTYDEALQAFNYFSEVGEWEKNFSSTERWVVVYLGATAMYFIGKRLKKKYALKDDVRESLYDACKLWLKQIGSNKFLGGNNPNLADLAVYGLLNSIEGCMAFQDLLANTKIGPWYFNVKEAVTKHQGLRLAIKN